MGLLGEPLSSSSSLARLTKWPNVPISIPTNDQACQHEFKIKQKHQSIKVILYDPYTQGTKNSLDLAKIGNLITFALEMTSNAPQ